MPNDLELAKLLHVVRIGAATLRHALYRTGASVPVHRHSTAVLVYGGGGPCIEHACEKPRSKRRLTFHPQGYSHALDYRGTTHVLAIELHDAADWPAHSAPLPATLFDPLWRVLFGLVQFAPAGTVDRDMADFLRRVKQSLQTRPPDWIDEVIRQLHDHWRTVPSAAAIAHRHGVSVQHLCRAFRQHTGVTLQQYGVALRLDHARGLLWASGVPISDVAAQTGFADQSHLTRVLGQRLAETPRQFRLLAPCARQDRQTLEWIAGSDFADPDVR